MRRTDANTRPARAPKEPKRFAAQAQYATQRKPSVLRRAAESERRAAERRAAESEQAQPGAMTGEEFVAQEKAAAKAAGFAPQRDKAPVHNHDARPKKVKLPPGWTPSKPEVEQYLKNLNKEANKIVRSTAKGLPKGVRLSDRRPPSSSPGAVGPGTAGFPGMQPEAMAQQRLRKRGGGEATAPRTPRRWWEAGLSEGGVCTGR